MTTILEVKTVLPFKRQEDADLGSKPIVSLAYPNDILTTDETVAGPRTPYHSGRPCWPECRVFRRAVFPAEGTRMVKKLRLLKGGSVPTFWSWAGVAQQACRGCLSRDDGGRKQFWVPQVSATISVLHGSA